MIEPLNWIDAVELVASEIQRLETEVQMTLMLASCLGSEFQEELLQRLTTYDVPLSLIYADRKGFVTCISPGIWRFAHDQIQQSAYSLIPEDERELAHLHIGRTLWKDFSAEMLSNHIFLVADQLKMGARLVVDTKERIELASLLLRAGAKATEASSFVGAANYLELGISLLPSRHWRDEYELSLSLYSAAAEVEHCKGNVERMRNLIEAVLLNARCHSDKIRVLTSSIYALGSSDEVRKAIDLGLEVLRELGVRFPRKPNALHVLVELRRTNARLRSMRDVDILNLPTIQDIDKLSAMRIMNLLFPYALTDRPMLAPLLATKNVHTTLDFGLSGMSCVGFSSFGILLCVGFGDVGRGIRYAELGLKLMNKLQAKEWMSRLYMYLHGFCLPYRDPLRDQLQPLLVAHRAGLRSGDIEFSVLAAATYAGIAIHASVPLLSLIGDMEAFLQLTLLHNQAAVTKYILPNLQFVKNLLGNSDEASILKGDVLDEEQFMREALESGIYTGVDLLLSTRLALASYFRKYDESEKILPLLLKFKAHKTLSFSMAALCFHEGLLLVGLYVRKRKRHRLRQARNRIKILRKLAATAERTYKNKVLLLEAEIANATGRFHEAMDLYHSSIGWAATEGLWSDAGLACECAAYALESKGRDKECTTFLEKAAACYDNWGATALVHSVKRRLQMSAIMNSSSQELARAA